MEFETFIPRAIVMDSVRVMPFSALAPAELAKWDEFQRARRELESPYFRPEFVGAVAEVTPCVEVAVIERDGRPIGFFPFERDWLGVGGPVGGSLSDFHGVIAGKDPQLSICELLAQCRLHAWDFQSAPAGQSLLEAFAARCDAAYFLDLSAGFDAYCMRRKKDGSETIEKTQRKQRRMIREERMRFEPRCRDPQLLDTLLTWKDRRYQELGVVSPVQGPRTKDLIERLLKNDSPELETFLSVVWAGETPAAIGLTLRSGPAAHLWLIGFHEAFSHYSPGLILVLQLAEQLAGEGVQRLHLGRGRERFKSSLATDQELVAAGIAGSWSMVYAGVTGWRWCKQRVKDSPLGAVVRRLQPVRYWLAYGKTAPPKAEPVATR